MLIVLLGAGNGMKNGIMSNFRNFSLNRVETWPRYTSKPYKGMQMNRRIEYKDEDLIAIPRENPEVDLITAVSAGAIRFPTETNIMPIPERSAPFEGGD